MFIRYAVFFFCILTIRLAAQCPSVALENLQSLEKTTAEAKESKILSLGFDLHQSFTLKGAAVRSYRKCWSGTNPKTFEQFLWWNQTANSISFMTANQGVYLSLRESVEGRHPSESGHRDVIVGRMFKYTFSLESVDGRDYYALTLALL
jgi:hypothetical protein